MSDLLLSEGATIKAKEADHFAFLISDLIIPDGTPTWDCRSRRPNAGNSPLFSIRCLLRAFASLFLRLTDRTARVVPRRTVRESNLRRPYCAHTQQPPSDRPSRYSRSAYSTRCDVVKLAPSMDRISARHVPNFGSYESNFGA